MCKGKKNFFCSIFYFGSSLPEMKWHGWFDGKTDLPVAAVGFMDFELNKGAETVEGKI